MSIRRSIAIFNHKMVERGHMCFSCLDIYYIFILLDFDFALSATIYSTWLDELAYLKGCRKVLSIFCIGTFHCLTGATFHESFLKFYWTRIFSDHKESWSYNLLNPQIFLGGREIHPWMNTLCPHVATTRSPKCIALVKLNFKLEQQKLYFSKEVSIQQCSTLTNVIV